MEFYVRMEEGSYRVHLHFERLKVADAVFQFPQHFQGKAKRELWISHQGRGIGRHFSLSNG